MKRTKFLPLLLGLFVLMYASAQEVFREEMEGISSDGINFQNFEGVVLNPNTVTEIRNIGRTLARMTMEDEMNNEIYRYGNKYAIRESGDYNADGLLSAAILYVNPDALVENVRNLRLIIAGYLEVRYEYSMADADLLAYLITIYNAYHRGDVNFFAARYKTAVMSDITASNAGLALSYTEWPGQTRLFIPLTFGGDLSLPAIIDGPDVNQLDQETKDDLAALIEESLAGDQLTIDNFAQQIADNEAIIDAIIKDIENILNELDKEGGNTPSNTDDTEENTQRGEFEVIIREVFPDGTIQEDMYDNVVEIITKEEASDESTDSESDDRRYIIISDKESGAVTGEKKINDVIIDSIINEDGEETLRVTVIVPKSDSDSDAKNDQTGQNNPGNKNDQTGQNNPGNDNNQTGQNNQGNKNDQTGQNNPGNNNGQTGQNNPGNDNNQTGQNNQGNKNDQTGQNNPGNDNNQTGQNNPGNDNNQTGQNNPGNKNDQTDQNNPGNNNGQTGQNNPGNDNNQTGQNNPGNNNGQTGQDNQGNNNNQTGQNNPGNKNDQTDNADAETLKRLEQLREEVQKLQDENEELRAKIAELQKGMQEKEQIANNLKEDQAAKDQAAKDQAAKDQAVKDQAAKDQAAKDQAAKDQAAKDQAAKDQAAKDQAAKDQAAKDQAAKDQAAKDQAAKDQAAKDQAAKDQAAKDQAAKDQAAKDQAAKDQAAKDQAAKDQAAKDQAAKDQAAKDQAEAEKQNKPTNPNPEKVNTEEGRAGTIYFMLDTGVRQGGRPRKAIVSFDLAEKEIRSRSPDNIASGQFKLTNKGIVTITEKGDPTNPKFYLTLLDLKTLQPISISDVPLHANSFLFTSGDSIYAMSESKGDTSVLIRFKDDLNIDTRSDAIVNPDTTLTQHEDYVFVEHKNGTSVLVLNRKDLKLIAEIKL